MKLLTMKDLRGDPQAVVGGRPGWRRTAHLGAQAPPGAAPGCYDLRPAPQHWPPPGGCTADGFTQCDGIMPAVTTVAGGGTGTLTFDVSAGNFLEFIPDRFVITAVDGAAVETDLIKGLRITAINYQGNAIHLGTAGIPAVLFDPDANQSLTLLRLPRLLVNGSDLTMTLSNVDAATTATVTASLIGRAYRQVI